MGQPDREQLPAQDSLTALEPMGPHAPDYRNIARDQADKIADALETILTAEPRTVGSSYARGIEKAEHRWALHEINLAKHGVNDVGQTLEGETRLEVLNRGLGKLQPAFDALTAERRAEVATHAATMKRAIGREIGEATKDDPAALEGAEAITAAANIDPAAMKTKLGDVISRAGAAQKAAGPAADLIDSERQVSAMISGEVEIPSAEGTKRFDFSAVRAVDDLGRVLSLYEAYVKFQELKAKDPSQMDAMGQAANTVEFLKVTGQIAQGVMETAGMVARGLARLKGAKDVVGHMDDFLRLTGKGVGHTLAALDALNGVFVLLSDTSDDMEKADAVKNIAAWAFQSPAVQKGLEAGARKAGEGAVGSALGGTASFLAHWGGPIAISIAITWEMLKWVGKETHEFHVTFSHFMMNHAFRELSHHGQEFGKHTARLGALAKRMELEQDPDVQQGIHDEWVEQTGAILSQVKAVAKITEPCNDYKSAGAYWTIQDRFAGIRARAGSVEKGPMAVEAGLECLAAIKDVLDNSTDYVDRESSRDSSREHAADGS